MTSASLARFWLQLVFELQSHFSRVRTFAFVADLVEITPLLEEQGLARGVEMLFAGGLIDVDENSDFGRAADMPHYEPVCDAVEVVRTAADLGTFAERLLAGAPARALHA